MPSEASADTLRSRYYDWCSAKVAERFLELSPEEIWRRTSEARETPAPPPGSADGEPGVFVSRHLFELVRTLAREMAHELNLPAFEAWAQAYVEDPEPYDRELLLFHRPVDAVRATERSA